MKDRIQKESSPEKGGILERTKKIGAESSDPNRHSQPRLPGSVVGEASMPRAKFPCKITEVTAPKLPSKKRVASSQKLTYFAATSECVIA